MRKRLEILFASALIISALITSAADAEKQKVVRLEAEDAKIVGAKVATARAGFSGKGYVSEIEHKTSKIGFKVNCPQGLYSLSIRYSSPFGNKGYILNIAGSSRDGTFFKTEDVFSTHNAGIVELSGQETDVAIEYGWGYYDIDYIELSPVEKPAPPAKPPATLCDPKATPAAKALMAELVARYGTCTMSGVQSFVDQDHVKGITGKTPAIIGADLMNYSPSCIEHGAKPKDLVEKMISQAKNGAVITLVWHWNAPSGLEKVNTDDKGNSTTEKWWSGFYTKATSFDIQKTLADPQSEDYKLLIRDIDAIAVQLKKCADADVPVLWRPLHESEFMCFWWGAKGPEPFVKLWKLLHERLTTHHGLHNLIWVFTGSADPQWYPGDEFVDIVGTDAYPKDRRDALSSYWQSLQEKFAGKKLLALTEFGGVPDIERMHKFGIWWSYFVSWTSTKGPKGMKNEDLIRIYNYPGVRNFEAPPAK